MDTTSCFEKLEALKDAGLEEFVCNGTFWILGIFVTLNAIWVSEQFDLYMDLHRRAKFDSIQSPEAAELLARPLPIRYFWLQPHITSGGRKFLALVGCTTALSLQSLELVWVYQAAWRLSVAVFNSQCEDRGSSPLAICIPTMGVILVVWFLLWKRSVAWTFGQISYLLQLYSLPTDHPTELKSSTARPPQNDSQRNAGDSEK